MFVGDWIGGRLGSEKLCPRRKLGFHVEIQRAKWFRALFICETWRRRPPGKPQSLAGSQGLQALINESLRRIWCAFGEDYFFLSSGKAMLLAEPPDLEWIMERKKKKPASQLQGCGFEEKKKPHNLIKKRSSRIMGARNISTQETPVGYWDRPVESFRLGKTFKIIESNCQPKDRPAKPR